MEKLQSELRSVAFGGEVEAGGAGNAPSVAGNAGSGRGKCPVNIADLVSGWAGSELMCRAGRREFKLNRYSVVAVRDGAGLRRAIDEFLQAVRRHEKSGLMAVVGGAVTRAATVREELALLAAMICEAGLSESPDAALAGKEICLPVEMACPVTGLKSVYSFFPVTFCRNASQSEDELYDVSLSCPWTAINTTSDAFAFALMVRDRARRVYRCEPYEIADAGRVRALFDWGVKAWQNMSVGTISAFSRLSVRKDRAVALSSDAQYWTAAHQDPVFAELKKEAYAHEMPVIYAQALAAKWFAAMFDGESFEAGREGQAGGIRVFDGVVYPHELQRLSIP